MSNSRFGAGDHRAHSSRSTSVAWARGGRNFYHALATRYGYEHDANVIQDLYLSGPGRPRRGYSGCGDRDSRSTTSVRYDRARQPGLVAQLTDATTAIDDQLT